MELVSPSVTRLITMQNRNESLNIALMKKIERCGRIAYRSEDKITDDSYIRFIKGIVQRGHWSVLEHSRITLNIKRSFFQEADFEVLCDYLNSHHFLNHSSMQDVESWFSISGNFRAFLEWLSISTSQPCSMRYIKHYLAKQFPPVFGGLIDDDDVFEPRSELFHLVEDPAYFTYHVVTDRGVMAEWTRHRYNMSFTVESTRYCNYNKKGVTFCLPIPFIWSPTEDANDQKFLYNLLKQCGCIGDEGEGVFYTCMNGVSFDGVSYLAANFHTMCLWLKHMEACERVYNEMIERKLSPQEARSVLPQSLKSEFCVTGTKEAWDHFLELRTAPDAHPQIRYLANMIQKELKNA